VSGTLMARRTSISGRSAALCLWLAFCTAGPRTLHAEAPDRDAFVYILNFGIRDTKIVYRGLRVGFAVGDGRTVITAAHCMEDFENDGLSLFQPLVISRYYGDAFEADIVDIDEQNDIALLRPTWNSHPGLKIETGNQWKAAEKIVIAGYRPRYASNGAGEKLSRLRSLEEETVVRTRGKGRYAIQLGSVEFPGKGWSGSAFVMPDTGAVVGVLSNERYTRSFFRKKHYIFGCNPEAISDIFRRNASPPGVPNVSPPIAGAAEHFDAILLLFDSILANEKEQSRDIARMLCRKCPDSYVLHIIAAWILDAPEDEEYFFKAIDLAHDRPLPHAAYGSYLLNHNRPKRALPEFESTLAIDPNHIFAQTGRIIALTRTNPPEAEAEAREMVKRWPSNGRFWFELSRTLRAQRKYEQELPIIEKAIQLPHPERLEQLYRRHLADSLANNKNYSEAEEAYKLALKDHLCARCWSAYASLLIRMGPARAADARAALDKAESLNKDNSVPPRNIERLETAIDRMTAAEHSEQ